MSPDVSFCFPVITLKKEVFPAPLKCVSKLATLCKMTDSPGTHHSINFARMKFSRNSSQQYFVVELQLQILKSNVNTSFGPWHENKIRVFAVIIVVVHKRI